MEPTADSREREWLLALRNGDEEALRRIFDQHYPLLLGDVYRIVPDEDTCKDLAQEVFVELWRKRFELDIHTSLRAYLRRAAVNRALTYLKTQRHLQFEGSEWDHAADTSAQDIVQQERQETLERALHRAIATLPEKCRIVFSLSRFEQRSHREIAEQLNISVKTIENQITKAMRLLREALVRHSDLSPIVILAIQLWYRHRG